MGEDRWLRLQILFESAKSLDPSAIGEFLDRECGEDTELRLELRSLLRRVPEAKDPLAEAVWATARKALAAQPNGGMGMVHAAEDPGLRRKEAQPEGQEETLALESVAGFFAPGEILGNRYRIRSQLGSGGMGEVWRAFDLKLRVDVALKALREELLDRERALETLRQEVRVAREVISPNVCRVFDLLELDGRELVSMEYIDGTTLAQVLRSRSPLELEEAQEIASQFLAGLEAIHRAGLVHRDVKPENVMITRSGRVVIMDFGVAKWLTVARTGTVAGTPAYMAPEQERGDVVDARADVFSAGVVLAEMTAPEGVRKQPERQALWRGVRKDLARLPESPWQGVLERAVARHAEERFTSAAKLARALEEVTLRVEGVDDVTPYPGLAAFTEDDAEYFFGREVEVEEMWKKLRRPHLLALIGPSGAGKSSFLRAGLLPTIPRGWRSVIFTPGPRPFTALGRVLADELAGDTVALKQLLEFEEPEVAVALVSRWRRVHKQALVIADQFEELFTLNPQQVQERFAELLSRLALEADVHVLLSMRDDFLFRCQPFESLAPILSELTLLGPLTGGSLRRALVQPALKCGYRFEGEALENEMVAEVGDERGALPMLAFAAARMWEKRNRESRLLTRKAYEEISGVSGALAQHAETTLERIGSERIPVARELFRNLATSQGTRAARYREELLSVFDEGTREPAGEVLDTLIDARLLTSYELPAAEGEEIGRHRIEIIHESLLSAWPRLVRWQTQDSEGAQLRDELRQTARMWDQHDRSDDLLWTGTAYKEFQLWRERYPGRLTETEENFAKAMVSHAERRRRRKRMALAAAMAALLVVLSVVTWSRFEALAEGRRAEAAKLLALGQLRFETDPTEALAFTMASLELSDTEAARIFAMTALWAGPPVLVLDTERSQMVVPRFSRDGRWLSLAGVASEEVLVWHQDGTGTDPLDEHAASPDNAIHTAWISGNELVTGHATEGRARIWSFPGGELRRQIDLDGRALWQAAENHLLASVFEEDSGGAPGIAHLRSWRMPDGEREELGVVDPAVLGSPSSFDEFGLRASFFDAGERGWAYTRGNQVFYRPLPVPEGAPDRLVGSHDNEALIVTAERDRLWTRDLVTGELRRWDPSAPSTEPLEILPSMPASQEGAWFQPLLGGRWLLEMANREGKARLWDRLSLAGADPREFRRSGSWFASVVDVHPGGDWIVATTRGMTELSFWPLRAPRPAVATGYEKFGWRPVVFTPDGEWLATYWGKNELRLWPLPGSGNRQFRALEVRTFLDAHLGLAADPTGERLFLAGYGGVLSVVSLEDGASTHQEGFSSNTIVRQGAFSPGGRLAAAATAWSSEEQRLRVWDLESGEAFDLPQPVREAEGENGSSSGFGFPSVSTLAFSNESTLFTAGRTGVLRWDLEAGTHEPIASAGPGGFAELWLSGDRRRLITLAADPADDECASLVLHDLQVGSARELDTFVRCEDAPWRLTFDSTLSVMAVSRLEGTIEVGRVEGGSPHLLTGHRGPISDLAISPDGRWVASSGEDKTLRLWPMPDLDEPPLHTLPIEELLTGLRSLTNLRAVRDEASSTGWSIEIGPFPGWREVPEW